VSEPIASCPHCREPVRSDHPYAWCSKCGERLPEDVQAQLPRLREIAMKASAARAGLQQEQSAGLRLADDAEVIARLYRRLVLLVGLQIVLSFARLPAVFSSAPVAIAWTILVLLALIVVIAALVVTTYKLAGHLKAGPPILWAIALFLPCINIIGLLALSSQAQSWCRRYGIKVGLLGPTKESIEELRRRVLSSTFE
jgi:hypothetical protein